MVHHALIWYVKVIGSLEYTLYPTWHCTKASAIFESQLSVVIIILVVENLNRSNTWLVIIQLTEAWWRMKSLNIRLLQQSRSTWRTELWLSFLTKERLILMNWGIFIPYINYDVTFTFIQFFFIASIMPVISNFFFDTFAFPIILDYTTLFGKFWSFLDCFYCIYPLLNLLILVLKFLEYLNLHIA